MEEEKYGSEIKELKVFEVSNSTNTRLLAETCKDFLTSEKKSLLLTAKGKCIIKAISVAELVKRDISIEQTTTLDDFENEPLIEIKLDLV